jgi:CRISPR-associated RAMP protein (TIGR02581 family)
MKDFLTLESRYTISYTLESVEGLHIGTGEESETSDAAVATRNGKAFLPGSTLRGVLRSSIERNLRAILGQDACCVMFAGEEENQSVACTMANKEAREKIEKGEKNAPALTLCPVCSFFGSTLMASKIKFTDAEQPDKGAAIVARDGVGIDRDTGTAKERIKFNFDVLDPHANFTGQMIVENPEDSDLGVLHMVLQQMKFGLHVGGLRNRGFGLVRMTSKSVGRLSGKEDLVKFFKSGTTPQLAEPAFDDLLSHKFRALCGE